MQPLVALSIAGSDSGGGAGIQADIRSFNAFGVFATTAITAVTAQNTLGVQGVVALEPSFVAEQITSVLDDFAVAGVKTGMLATKEIFELVATFASSGRLNNLVIDPVMVSTSGHQLVSNGGIDAYRTALLPFAKVVTPNLREACALLDVPSSEVRSTEHMIELGHQLLGFGPSWVLVKGGHLFDQNAEMTAPDVLISASEQHVFEATRIDTVNDHGTGCSLSSAIAARLALGDSVPDATKAAKQFVFDALRGAGDWRLGRGRGPIDHLGWNK